eukprot:5336994-Amphidinium_carterae.1
MEAIAIIILCITIEQKPWQMTLHDKVLDVGDNFLLKWQQLQLDPASHEKCWSLEFCTIGLYTARQISARDDCKCHHIAHLLVFFTACFLKVTQEWLVDSNHQLHFWGNCNCNTVISVPIALLGTSSARSSWIRVLAVLSRPLA